MSSQRAELGLALFASTPKRRDVVSFTQPIVFQFGTFLYKIGTGDGDIADLEELTNVPNIIFTFPKGSSIERMFKFEKNDALTKKIWKIRKVSDVILCTHWSVD